MTRLDTIEVPRLLTHDEASEYVTKVVPEIEANITKAGIYVDSATKEPFLIYAPLGDMTPVIRKAILAMNISGAGTVRQSTGMRNISRTFGMAPRKPYQRRESCRATSLAYEHPNEHAVMVALADQLGAMMQEYLPEVWSHGMDDVAEVAMEWRMTDHVYWTSGVINRTSALPYHRDGFNFDAWSAMPVIRKETRGGYLDIPEYDATIACRDGWALFFPGFRLVHGVTPITQLTPGGYRYSAVYYALRGMKDCFSYAMEASEGGKRRTDREDHLAKAIKGEEDFRVSPAVNRLGYLRTNDLDIKA
jgi:hypothetical protein